MLNVDERLKELYRADSTDNLFLHLVSILPISLLLPLRHLR